MLANHESQNQMDKSFLERLLGTDAPSKLLLGAFAIGVVLLSLWSDLLYDWLTASELVESDLLAVLAASIVLLVIASGLYLKDRRNRRRRVRVNDRKRPSRKPGLVAVAGPSRHALGAIECAVEHHGQNGKGVKHLWLLNDESDNVAENIKILKTRLASKELETEIHPVPLSDRTTKVAYEATIRVLHDAEAINGLQLSQLTVDCTGGTKPITIGMTLAALQHDVSLQYIESKLDDAGKPIDGTQEPVVVEYDFERLSVDSMNDNNADPIANPTKGAPD